MIDPKLLKENLSVISSNLKNKNYFTLIIKYKTLSKRESHLSKQECPICKSLLVTALLKQRGWVAKS